MDLQVISRELYGLPPEEFVATRTARAKEARGEGEAALAQQIGALRKPTVAAWLVNQLARYAELDLRVLLEIGDELREGLGELSGDELRALTRRRQDAVATLLARAQQLAADQGRAAGGEALAGVRTTLEATLADAASADAVKAGCLAEPLEAGGFGFALGAPPVPAFVDEPDGDASVSDLDERRERKAAAVRAAEQALAEAEAGAEAAEADAAGADDRLAKARRRLEKASAQVARVRLELAAAEAAEADAARRVEKRQAAVDAHKEELDDARDLVVEARAVLDRLR